MTNAHASLFLHETGVKESSSLEGRLSEPKISEWPRMAQLTYGLRTLTVAQRS